MSDSRLRRLHQRLDQVPSSSTSSDASSSITAVPDVIRFATDPQYLGRTLYPRQGLLLKIIFLAVDLFTSYDEAVIEQWTTRMRTTGQNGISPDVRVRMAICRSQGRRWFREIIAVIGRRGGKGYIGAIALAYVLYHYMALGSPQEHYGLAPDKRLVLLVFGAKRDQARDNLFRDLVNVITAAPCFDGFVAQVTTDSVLLFTPADRARIAAGDLPDAPSSASIEIAAKESTLTAGRGPASFAFVFDEMAHVEATGTTRSAEEVYDAATPSLDQFGPDAFLYEPSSPWQQQGRFYANFLDGLQVEPDGSPSYASKLVVQLTSWDPYEDWERSHEIEMTPGGQHYPKITRPIQSYDDNMRELERANPETFAVERRSNWRTSRNAYLNPNHVDDVFGPWRGHDLQVQTAGKLGTNYKMHIDPSLVGANFAVTIAHVEQDDDGNSHVIFDYIRVWRPADFPRGEVEYTTVTPVLKELVTSFRPVSVTADQWNSAGPLDDLRAHVRNLTGGYTGTVVERRPENRNGNWAAAENFKASVNRGRVHAPHHELAIAELKYLEDVGGAVRAPTRGPVQTCDIADAMIACVVYFLEDGNAASIQEAFSQSKARAIDTEAMLAGSSANPYASALGAFSASGRAGEPPGLHRGRHGSRPPRQRMSPGQGG